MSLWACSPALTLFRGPKEAHDLVFLLFDHSLCRGPKQGFVALGSDFKERREHCETLPDVFFSFERGRLTCAGLRQVGFRIGPDIIGMAQHNHLNGAFIRKHDVLALQNVPDHALVSVGPLLHDADDTSTVLRKDFETVPYLIERVIFYPKGEEAIEGEHQCAFGFPFLQFLQKQLHERFGSLVFEKAAVAGVEIGLFALHLNRDRTDKERE
jgi:hypothetical protein